MFTHPKQLLRVFLLELVNRKRKHNPREHKTNTKKKKERIHVSSDKNIENCEQVQTTGQHHFEKPRYQIELATKKNPKISPFSLSTSLAQGPEDG